MVHSQYSADINHFSLSYREVLYWQSWWYRSSFRRYKCSHTLWFKVQPRCIDDHVCIWSVSIRSHLRVLSLIIRPCSTYILVTVPYLQTSWTLAILCNVLSSTSLINSKSFSGSVSSNTGSLPGNIPEFARVNYFTRTFWWRVLWVGVNCLMPIKFAYGKNWPPLRHSVLW